MPLRTGRAVAASVMIGLPEQPGGAIKAARR
ncbi:hypothetical protein KS03_443 [Burkholderia glumae LMG 2196 = ATCC 33617]|nr:hypothetical protein KS03_443 [Burkholderia glumae LMG 2196 = ATCC 33617]